MPRGPKGERRPADVIGNAVHILGVTAGPDRDGRFGGNASFLQRRLLIGGLGKRAMRAEEKLDPEISGRKFFETAG